MLCAYARRRHGVVLHPASCGAQRGAVTTMATHIEPARPADTEGIRQLVVDNGLPLDGLNEHLRTTLVAREDGHIVGTAAVEMYEDGALLRSVAVAPKRQGQGLGHELTEAAVHLARDRGCGPSTF